MGEGKGVSGADAQGRQSPGAAESRAGRINILNNNLYFLILRNLMKLKKKE
jgi:hypothetical protein